MNNNLTLQDLIDELTRIRDNTTTMHTTPTDVAEVLVRFEGSRKVLLQPAEGEDAEYWRDEAERLEDELDDAQEEIAELKRELSYSK